MNRSPSPAPERPGTFTISDEPPTGLARGVASGEVRLYVRPLALNADASLASLTNDRAVRPLAGGPLAFEACELLMRRIGEPGRVLAWRTPLESLAAWASREGAPVDGQVTSLLDRLARRRAPFAGLSLDRPRLMGVLNVTPDSFADGGVYREAEAAIAHGRRMIASGADIVDIGGESTRPHASFVSVEEELDRVRPVITGLSGAGVPISIDTRRARVMAAALDAGAGLVNDVSALSFDPDSLALVAERGVPVVLMHMRGEPATMHGHTDYAAVLLDVYDELAARVAACHAAGIPAENIAIDPGLGFAKTSNQNAAILRGLSLFLGFGLPLLVGASRKGLVRAVKQAAAPEGRLPASLAVAMLALDQGAGLLRVHDVGETAQAIAVWQALRSAP